MAHNESIDMTSDEMVVRTAVLAVAKRQVRVNHNSNGYSIISDDRHMTLYSLACCPSEEEAWKTARLNILVVDWEYDLKKQRVEELLAKEFGHQLFGEGHSGGAYPPPVVEGHAPRTNVHRIWDAAVRVLIQQMDSFDEIKSGIEEKMGDHSTRLSRLEAHLQKLETLYRKLGAVLLNPDWEGNMSYIHPNRIGDLLRTISDQWWLDADIPQDVTKMEDPVKCRFCFRSFDLTKVRSLQYKQGSQIYFMFHTPCCGMLADNRETKESPDYVREPKG